MQAKRFYRFGPYRLDPAERLLLRGSDPIPLTPKAFDTLLVLVENSGHLLEKDELLSTLWADTIVEERNLAQQIFLLRKSLGDGADGRPFIETVPKRGYRFSGSVTEVFEKEDEPSHAPRKLESRVQKIHGIGGGDQALHLVEAGIPTQSSPPAPRSDSARVVPVKVGRGRGRWLALVIAAVIGGIGAGTTVWRMASSRAPALPTRLTLTGSPGIGLESATLKGIAMSPGGTTLVYVVTRPDGMTELYRRSLSEFSAGPIPGTKGAAAPFFSPDGEWVGFFAEGKLKKVALEGGHPITICAAAASHGAWGGGDSIIFSGPFRPLFQVPAEGGEPRAITRLNVAEGEIGHAQPHFLPGGKGVLFRVVHESYANVKIAELSLETGERKILLDGSSPQFTPSGHLVFEREGCLWAVGFDLDRLALRGSPEPVLEDVHVTDIRAAEYTFSSNGTLVYRSKRNVKREIVWVDRGGGMMPALEHQAEHEQIRISPDGRRLAVIVDSPGRGSDVWVYDIEAGTRIRLTSDGQNSDPLWWPDGTRVAFQAAHLDIAWAPADGSGDVELLVTSEKTLSPTSWSPDGQLLVYERGNPRDIWVKPLDGDPVPFLTTPYQERGATFSPDGGLLAYASNESGRYEVYVQPYPGPGAKVAISTNGGAQPLWSRDRSELFFREGNRVMVVAVGTNPFRASAPRPLFDTELEGVDLSADYTENVAPMYDVSLDGRFAMLRTVPPETAGEFRVILNWFYELERLAPTGR